MQVAYDEIMDQLSFSEFNLIQFRQGLPTLLLDLVHYLTGKTLSGTSTEDDQAEFTTKNKHALLLPIGEKELCPGPFHDPEIEGIRNSMKPEEYNQFLSLFQRFLNYYPDEKKLAANLQQKFVEEKCYLTEEDIITNFKNVFGYDCTYFAKLIYLLLSGGYDKQKISMTRFVKEFMILKGEDIHYAFNSLAFKLYDVDRDDSLNLMNLLHLQMNIAPTSLVGREIFK
jgi:hypothetical protein